MESWIARRGGGFKLQGHSALQRFDQKLKQFDKERLQLVLNALRTIIHPNKIEVLIVADEAIGSYIAELRIEEISVQYTTGKMHDNIQIEIRLNVDELTEKEVLAVKKYVDEFYNSNANSKDSQIIFVNTEF